MSDSRKRKRWNVERKRWKCFAFETDFSFEKYSILNTMLFVLLNHNI